MSPLTPAKPKPFPGAPGTVYRSERNTYLYCGMHFNDSYTGERLAEPVHLMIVWQGGTFCYRNRMTFAEVQASGMQESRRGLTPDQMNHLAMMAFRNWEELEYAQIRERRGA